MITRRIPTKRELQQLQKLYRTDKKIGQALGGIPEQLVAYWRRKKGIGPAKFPKYTQQEVRDLWERFGDDEKAGQQLGITKQAFYRWRKKYNLLDKPTILKLEQLELKFFDEQRLNRAGNSNQPAQTFFQKILAHRCGQTFVAVSEKIEVPVDYCLSIAPDGLSILDPTSNGGKNIDQVPRRTFNTFMEMFQEGYFQPGRIIVADTAAAAALGVTSSLVKILPSLPLADKGWQGRLSVDVKPTVKAIIPALPSGRRAAFDAAAAISYELRDHEDRQFSVEIVGPGLERMSLEDRMALLSYATLFTGRSVVLEPDQTYLNLLKTFADRQVPIPFSDKHVYYQDEITVYVGGKPLLYDVKKKSLISGASHFGKSYLKRVRIGPLISGTAEDMKLIATSLRHTELPPSLELIIIPANREAYLEALKRRYVHRIVEAGGRVGNVVSLPAPAALLRNEFELTTELYNAGDQSYIASIETIAKVLSAGKITRDCFELT